MESLFKSWNLCAVWTWVLLKILKTGLRLFSFSSDFCYFSSIFPGIFYENFQWDHTTRGPLVLYCSPECWRYAELEQTWKYKSTPCSKSCHPHRSIRNKINRHKNGQGKPRVIIWKYIAADQGQTTPGDKILMSTETSCHFGNLL